MTLGPGHSFHNGTPYYSTSVTISTVAGFTFPTNQIVEFAGIRINHLETTGATTIALRAILKTNNCLRSDALHEDVLLDCVVFKILLAQSWISSALSDLQDVRACMTTGGPSIDGSHSTLTTIVQALRNFSTGMRTASISSTELATMKTNFLNQNSILNNSPELVSGDLVNTLAASPTSINIITAANFPKLKGFPYHAISQSHVNNFTLQNCTNCITSWFRAPLEIMIVDNVTRTNLEIATDFLPLLVTHYPDTSYRANGSRRGFSTYGGETIVTCQGGVSGDSDMTLTVNLGPVTKESIIAADLVRTQFANYVAGPRSPLAGSAPEFRIEWAPCAGCVLVMIRLAENFPQIVTPPDTYNRIKQIGVLRFAFDQFRINLTAQEIENNLVDNWTSSLGTNQAIRNYTNWSTGATNLDKFRDWWVEVFGGGEAAFEELDTLAASLAAGDPPGTIYEDIRTIIRRSFTASSRHFDLWIFRKD
ncbi:hypothetical protein [Candidatus Similichlamydia epinepheli]|uniref:hypothetical protein n=1 Tax=Candidatus Similichlamydia epinepheli TaxID=1903953 RepID=UPI000D3A0F9F|nr:hypothetical protein [Candidatus Similichlamydia epinepheli]